MPASRSAARAAIAPCSRPLTPSVRPNGWMPTPTMATLVHSCTLTSEPSAGSVGANANVHTGSPSRPGNGSSVSDTGAPIRQARRVTDQAGLDDHLAGQVDVADTERRERSVGSEVRRLGA